MQGVDNRVQKRSSESIKQPPLIAHVIQQLTVGGLENGLVNLINHIPAERYL